MTPARLDMLTLIIGSDYFRELPAEERAEWWEEAFMEALDALLKMEMRAEDAETELVDMLCRKARTRERELVKERRREDTVKLNV